MKTYTIQWTRKSLGSGITNIKARSESAAEKQFDKLVASGEIVKDIMAEKAQYAIFEITE